MVKSSKGALSEDSLLLTESQVTVEHIFGPKKTDDCPLAAARKQNERLERQQRQRRAEALREEAERLEREARAARASAEAEAAQQAEEALLREWLTARGFKGTAAKKSSWFSASFPLHAAVRENNEEIVRLLLAAGADAGQGDSKGVLPLDLARKLASKAAAGSYAGVLALLVPPPRETMSYMCLFEVEDFDRWYAGFAAHGRGKTGPWTGELLYARQEVMDEARTRVLVSVEDPRCVLTLFIDVDIERHNALHADPNYWSLRELLGVKVPVLELKLVSPLLACPAPAVVAAQALAPADLLMVVEVADAEAWIKGIREGGQLQPRLFRGAGNEHGRAGHVALLAHRVDLTKGFELMAKTRSQSIAAELGKKDGFSEAFTVHDFPI